jgi:hypothetical protein
MGFRDNKALQVAVPINAGGADWDKRPVKFDEPVAGGARLTRAARREGSASSVGIYGWPRHYYNLDPIPQWEKY